jgi:hypothetical protein
LTFQPRKEGKYESDNSETIHGNTRFDANRHHDRRL